MLEAATLLGALVVGMAGLIMGSSAWPYKLMRKYQFEHWWFTACVMSLVVMPWTIALAGTRHPWEAIASVPLSAVIVGNLFSLGWGVANILCGLCYYRIGVALTGAVLAGLGSSVGAIVPLVLKGSGGFRDAPGIASPAGVAVLVGVAVLLVGVAFASVAGFGRDRALKGQQQTSGSFVVGLLMAAVSGVLSSFMSFVFVYSQAPIVASFSDVERGKTITVAISGRKHECRVASDGALALDALGGTGTVVLDDVNAAQSGRLIAKSLGSVKPEDVRVETGSISATFAVFAVGLIGGALLNIGYAAYLLTRNRSWGVLLESKKELLLSLVIGVNFSVAVTLMGKGMLLLGALGASVGFGIQQAMQMTGGQLLGFVSGEWRGVHGKPRIQMYAAIAVLIAASLILAYGNTLSKN